MATIRILLGIICLIALGWCGLPRSGVLRAQQQFRGGKTFSNRLPYKTMQTYEPEDRLLSIALKELGVREQTGHNDGPHVETYLHYVGLAKGAPWCAAFVSWVFGQAGYKQPRTAWSPALFPANRRTLNKAPACIFGIYFANLKRIAHCGFVAQVRNDWIVTIEGNTNGYGNRDGDGVYRKWRHQKTIKYYSNWLPTPKIQLPGNCRRNGM